MNQEAKKSIKSSFCPKQKWVLDKDVINCYKCKKKFHPLYRRKHHCRYCGEIFCNVCSNYFFEGKDLDEAEKQVRMCQACHQKCWKSLVKHDQLYVQYRKSNGSKEQRISDIVEGFQIEKSSSFTDEDKITEIKMIVEDYTNSDLEGIRKLEEGADHKFMILLQVMMKERKIPLRRFADLLNIIKQVVKRSPLNALVTNDMDICRNVVFKCLQAPQFSISLDSNILVRKNFQSKRIKEQYEGINCILIYGGIESAELVGGEKEASFEDIVNNRSKQISKLISYCERENINMIFIEGNVELEYAEKFLSSEIVVVSKVKIEHLYRLKVGLGIEKIVNSVKDVYNYTKEEIFGRINKLRTQSFVPIKSPEKTKKFLLVQSIRDELGMTIFIRGPDRELLDTIKSQLSEMIMLLRHIRLKVHQVLIDQRLLDSMSESMRNQCYKHNPEMFFSFYNEHHSDLLNYLKEKYLSFKQITYVCSDFKNYPQVNRMRLDEYTHSRKHSFRDKWDYFTEICGQIKDQHRRFYSEEDCPFGVYLIKKFATLSSKCQKCGKSNYQHIDIFYSTDHYLKVWMESKIVDFTDTLSMVQSSSKECTLAETSQISFGTEEVALSQDKQNNYQFLFMHFPKQQKCKLQCYIECEKCQQCLSARIRLSREHLEYSMAAFLNHFFKGTTETIIRQNNQSYPSWSKHGACQHFEKVRVIEMGDKYLKIMVGSFILSRLCVLTKTGRQNYLDKKEAAYTKQYCILKTNKIDQIVNMMLDDVKSIAESTKSSRFQRIIKDPRASFNYARASIIKAPNVKLSQSQCIDMIIPELVEELIKINTISGLLLNPKKTPKFLQCEKLCFEILSLLKKLFIIMNELKKSIKRRDLEMKYEKKDFDCDFMMEEIDINSIGDSSSLSEHSYLVDEESERDYVEKDMISIGHDLGHNLGVESDAYDWLQPNSEKVAKGDRRTVYDRRNPKATAEQAIQIFKQISSFMRVEAGYLDFVPCYPSLLHSMIASALNSQAHKQCLTSTNFLSEIKVHISKFLETPLKTDSEQLRKIENIVQIHERMFDITTKMTKMLNNSLVTHDIIFLYPNQFEQLRRKHEIPLQLFIESIAGGESWLASGGKSGSPFMRSFNDMFVIKKVNVKEFMTFKKFLPEYFTHLHSGSLLVPIYGAYIVSKSSNNHYYIVMKNLFFGMKDWYLYDLKGSVARRFSKFPVIPLDVNFLIDRNSEPLFCKDNILKNLKATLDYLVKNNIIDYSLILVVEIEDNRDYYMDGNRFHIGIIDYLREFGAFEKAERTWKGSDCTVQEPTDYSNRMLKNLKKYFTRIPL